MEIVKDKLKRHEIKFIINKKEKNEFLNKSKLKTLYPDRIVERKIRVKYLRSYYELEGLGRITLDRNIEFFSPSKEFHYSKKINDMILEVKIQSNKIDKNIIEKIINLRETRFSKYCIGVNNLLNSR